MKICIATSSYPAEGGNEFAGSFVLSFAKELVRKGITVSVYTQDTGRNPIPAEGILTITFPWSGKGIPLSTLKPYDPLDVLKMWSVLRRGARGLLEHCGKQNIDFVLAMWALPGGYWANTVKKSTGIPYAVWCLGSDIWGYGSIPFLRMFVQKIIKQSSHCFADGISLAREVERIARVKCIFLPTTRVLPLGNCLPLSLDPLKRHYLFIGRYHRNKGPDILIDALRLMDRETLSGIRFHFFGTGPLEKTLRRMVSEYGLSDVVSIGGPVSEKMVVSLLRTCSALIIPSRIESIPVVLSDALQVGCDVIVTPAGDMGNLVRFYGAGIVAEDSTPEALRDAIRSHIGKGDRSFEGGRRNLCKLFDLERSVEIFLESVLKPNG